MPEHELWLTALFNDQLAGLGNSILALFGQHASPRPWKNFITMQIVVALVVVVVFAILRARLSMDRPGKLQHAFELIYQFLHGQADETIGHHDAHKHLAFVGTLFIFILFSNLLGVIPTFESPTMFPYVPAGCAIATFLYYNVAGVAANGIFGYLKHFLGPVLWMAPLMFVIEIISHLARPMSLTIRLFANMFAGEQVTMAFLSLTYFGVPALFMGLHVFVAFLQAYVFALLTMIYIGGAVAHEH